MNEEFDEGDLDAILQTEGAWAESEDETLRRRAATWKRLAKVLWRERKLDLLEVQLVRMNDRLERDLHALAIANKWHRDYNTANGERLRLEEECASLRKEINELELEFLDLRAKLDLCEFAETQTTKMKPSLRERAIEGALDFFVRMLK